MSLWNMNGSIFFFHLVSDKRTSMSEPLIMLISMCSLELRPTSVIHKHKEINSKWFNKWFNVVQLEKQETKDNRWERSLLWWAILRSIKESWTNKVALLSKCKAWQHQNLKQHFANQFIPMFQSSTLRPWPIASRLYWPLMERWARLSKMEEATVAYQLYCAVHFNLTSSIRQGY